MKSLTLLSSGIDSPVAAYVLSSYLDEIILLHADGRPYTDDREIKNFLSLANHLDEILSCSVRIGMVPHGESLDAYKRSMAHPRFCCVFCKRMMLRYAEALARNEGVDGVIMGDSLGQVASQTLQNIQVVDSVVQIPVLRPLIGFDKEEIVKIAKKIGTYDLSIKESAGCLAVPDKPATKARIEQLADVEKGLDIEGLVRDAVLNIEWVNTAQK